MALTELKEILKVSTPVKTYMSVCMVLQFVCFQKTMKSHLKNTHSKQYRKVYLAHRSKRSSYESLTEPNVIGT